MCFPAPRPWQTPPPVKPSARRWPWWLALTLLLLLVLALGLAVQRAPALEPVPPAAGGAQLATEARLLWQQLRPGAAPAGALRRTRLGERELNALLDQAARTQGGRWRAQLSIDPDQLRLQAQHPLPGLPSLWLNLQLAWDLRQPRPGQLPPLQSARLGRLPLPSGLIEWLAGRWLQQRLGSSPEPLLTMLEGWQAGPRQLWLSWRWRPEQAAQAVAALWSPAERQALVAQHLGLRQALRDWPAFSAVELEPVLRHLSQQALRRVTDEGADPATELRAVLLVLGLQSLGRDLGAWLPEARADGPAPPVRLVIADRDDMAQHFLLAALLSWQGGERLSQALGLAKELADARVGSGFSFNDLAADEAGNRLGRLGAAQPGHLLAQLASELPSSAYFPDIGGLPEFLHEAEFRARYGRVGSPAYEAEMNKVRARVAALPLYQQRPAP